MGNSRRARRVLSLTVALTALAGCTDGARKSALHFPLLTPPVRAATPTGLGGTAPRAAQVLRRASISGKRFALDTADIKSRFFTAGPTSIFKILGDVDARVDEINRASSSGATCLTQEPVPYTLTPFGQTLTFYAQCFRTFESSPTETSFLQFGLKDGIVYLYFAMGAEHVAARITPVGDTVPDAGPVSSKYRVDAYIGVGYNNATSCGPRSGFDSCSYGAIELHSDESRVGLELTVAGVGFGYCGAQLKSDGVHVFAIGSLDMGESCLTMSTLCVAASDLTTPGICSAELAMFTSRALGRTAVSGSNGAMGESQYPGKTDNTIVLNGTATDSLGFGPSAPSPGVGDLSAAKP